MQLVFKKWVENIQTAAYNGRRTVIISDYGLFKVNLEMAIFGFDLENEVSVCVINWESNPLILGC